MEAKFEYETGKVTRDFKIVRFGERCKLSGLPAYVGNERCRKCKHYGSMLVLDGFFAACMHPEQKDSDNILKSLNIFYEQVRSETLNALCY